MKQNNKILNTILLAWLFVMAFVPASQALDIDAVNNTILADTYNISDVDGASVIGTYDDGYACEHAYCVYIPWYNISLVKAKNGATGVVESISTSADVVGQYAINASSGKGCVYIRGGKYHNVSWVIYKNDTCIIGEIAPVIGQDLWNGVVLYQNTNNDPVISTPVNASPLNGTIIEKVALIRKTSFTDPVLDLVDVRYTSLSKIQILGYGRIRTSLCTTACYMGTFKDSGVLGYILHEQTDWLYDDVHFAFNAPGYGPLLAIAGTATRVTNGYFWSGWKAPAMSVTGNAVQVVITNNQIDQVGNTYAIKLESTIGSGRNVVSHNMIFETNGTGIIVSSSNNVITDNQFYRTGYGRGHNYSGDVIFYKGTGVTAVKFNTVAHNSHFGEASERTKYAVYEVASGNDVEFNSFKDNVIDPAGYPVPAYDYANWTQNTKNYSKGNVALDANINQTY